jgi:hypothetical protein
MTEQRRREIRAELARRMGNHVWFTDGSTRWLSTKSGMAAVCRRYPEIRETDEEMPIDWQESDIPDPFTDAADNRALVEWLAANMEDEACDRFNVEMQKSVAPYGGFDALTMLAASLETVTLAAAKALGIQEASE